MIATVEQGFDNYVNKLALSMLQPGSPQEVEELATFKAVEEVLGLSGSDVEKAWNEAKKIVTSN
ncbi:hypothetical protein BMS3Abin15_00523 [bacterium BMS3Abin15]|nr:hypothetical protein BMS3Abin15_00523 [bacterium BMS3Abin15]HDH07643.1 hypothetical protein [Candidatus Moranbacteria bacterium]HDZ86037.1 hypothetical protein [Candidatus Moranbacteria bacterium]